MNHAKQFLDMKVRDIAARGNVPDIGGSKRFQKWLTPYRRLFDQAHYRTLDTLFRTSRRATTAGYCAFSTK